MYKKQSVKSFVGHPVLKYYYYYKYNSTSRHFNEYNNSVKILLKSLICERLLLALDSLMTGHSMLMRLYFSNLNQPLSYGI